MALGWLARFARGRRTVPVRRGLAPKPWLRSARSRTTAPVAALRTRTLGSPRNRPLGQRSLLARLAAARWPRSLRVPAAWRAQADRAAPAALSALAAARRVAGRLLGGLGAVVAWVVAAVRRTAARAPSWVGLAPAPTEPRAVAGAPVLVSQQAPAIDLPERGLDLVLLLAVLGLLSIGSTMIYSATCSVATQGAHGTLLVRQLVYVSLGGAAMWHAARMDYRKLRAVTYPLLALSLVLLFAALLFAPRNGAHRWIGLGSLTFQPVELAKLALLVYVAQSLARKADRVKTFTVGFVPHLVVCGAMMLLLLKQPDLGSSVVLGATTLAMLFVAGARISYLVLAILATAPIAYHLVVGTPWRMQRVLAYFNPEAYAQTEAYQFLQARLAIGSGGLFGAGLGRGNQTLGYLPEAHNDFIAAPIGEELGFVGVAVVLVLFGVLVWRGLRAALGARDAFGCYLAFGITFLLGAQALFNLGVVFGVIPNKGITLPLVSYGGTSLIVTMFLVGLLLNVSRRPHWRQAPRALVNTTRRKRQRVRIAVA